MIFTSIYFFILIELVVISYVDMTYRVIKNFWAIVNMTFFLLFLLLFPDVYPISWQGLMYSLSFLVVGFALFIMRVMGAGDSKYLASLFLLIPQNLQYNFFEILLYTTFCVGLGMIIMNTWMNRRQVLQALATKNFDILKTVYGTRFTYAPLILLSWIWLGWDIMILVGPVAR